MKIVVVGGSGFLGEPLVQRLASRGDDVAVLTRDPSRLRAGRPLPWDGRSQGAWSDEVAAADVVINLAGENVGDGRWTAERKRRLVASRIDATHAIVEALRRHPSRPRTLINASAVGYYGDRKDEILDENASRGEGFLAELVERWESAAREAAPLARLVLLRLGVVLASDGGALAKMLLPFRLGVGGPIGNGRQWMSWVAREDVLRAIEWAIGSPAVSGIYNITAPQPVRSREFAQALGKALHRPAVMPVPAIALKLALGQMAEETLLPSQRAVPRRTEGAGFTFQYGSIDAALGREFN